MGNGQDNPLGSFPGNPTVATFVFHICHPLAARDLQKCLLGRRAAPRRKGDLSNHSCRGGGSSRPSWSFLLACGVLWHPKQIVALEQRRVPETGHPRTLAPVGRRVILRPQVRSVTEDPLGRKVSRGKVFKASRVWCGGWFLTCLCTQPLQSVRLRPPWACW